MDLLASYQIERHIRKEKDEGTNRLKKEVALSPEFRSFGTESSRRRPTGSNSRPTSWSPAVLCAIKKMEKIEAADIRVTAGSWRRTRRRYGKAVSVAEEQLATATARARRAGLSAK